MRNKQTKIVATISDLRCDVDFLKEIYDNGVNVFRVNTAHQMPKDTLKVMRNVKKVSTDAAIVVDIKGPEIRTRNLKEKFIAEPGSVITFKDWDEKSESTKDLIYVSYKGFVKDVSVDNTILIDDGEVSLKVVKKDKDSVECKVLSLGQIGNNKSINVPGVKMNIPPLSDKDKLYIDFCNKHKVDYIAHSFVRNKNDVIPIQKAFDKAGNNVTKIIAKIENQEGVNNIDEILDHVHAIMIARGDLAIEIPAWEVPIAQKLMIKKCIQKGKPVITATQMLHTMIKNPRPTRAEISDIATAVFAGSDAVMLSGETAYGDYPVEAVKYMANTIKKVEENKEPFKKPEPTFWHDDVQRYLAKAAHEATLELPIKAIICSTQQGDTARLIASYRPGVPVYAKCVKEHVVRRLSLQYGVYASLTKSMKDDSKYISKSLRNLVETKKLKMSDLVLLIGTTPKDKIGPEFIEIRTIKEHLNRHES
jgi:pyruvate kinase